MDASSNSGGEEAPLPDLTFPILEPVPAREIPAPPSASTQAIEAANQVIELSEALLPVAAAQRPESEARRLEMKTSVPFRLLDEEPSARASR